MLKKPGYKTRHTFPTQWQAETQEFCPSAKVVLVGCKMDTRTDLNVTRELAKHRLIPVTHEQVRSTKEKQCSSTSCTCKDMNVKKKILYIKNGHISATQYLTRTPGGSMTLPNMNIMDLSVADIMQALC